MFLDPQSFIIFVGAFIVCGALLGMIFFTGDDFQVLRRMAGMPTRPVAREIGNSPAVPGYLSNATLMLTNLNRPRETAGPPG